MNIAERSRKFLEKLRKLTDVQKKVILWTIVAILAIILGFFWVRGAINSLQKVGDGIGQIDLPQFQLPKMSNIPVLNSQTDDWKIYTNEEYGFEIKVPNNWIIQRTSNGLNITTDALLKQNDICFKQQIDNCDPGELPYAIAYFKFMAEDGNKYSDDELKNGISTIELNGLKWHRYVMGGMFSDIHFRVIDDKKSGYDFNVYMDADENIMKTVLSTFKFIK